MGIDATLTFLKNLVIVGVMLAIGLFIGHAIMGLVTTLFTSQTGMMTLGADMPQLSGSSIWAALPFMGDAPDNSNIGAGALILAITRWSVAFFIIRVGYAKAIQIIWGLTT